MPTAFMRMTSSMEVMMVSSERSSLSTLLAPLTRKTIGVAVSDGMQLRSTPRVSMSVSAYGASGAHWMLGCSRPLVGPRK